MAAGQAGVVREEYATSHMLIAVDCISAQQRSDIILLALAGGHQDRVVELGAEFLPFAGSSSGIDFAVIILLLRDVDHVALVVGHAVSTD